jgi:hypothetical protein
MGGDVQAMRRWMRALARNGRLTHAALAAATFSIAACGGAVVKTGGSGAGGGGDGTGGSQAQAGGGGSIGFGGSSSNGLGGGGGETTAGGGASICQQADAYLAMCAEMPPPQGDPECDPIAQCVAGCILEASCAALLGNDVPGAIGLANCRHGCAPVTS